MMRLVDLDALAAVARQLDQLGVPYAFTGGVVIGFLLDHPHLTTLRPTGDVDAIAAVVTRIQHTALEEQLRQLGFHHDTSEGAPICRWLYQGTKVDVMPAKDTAGQKSNPWFEHALRTASLKTLRHVTVRVVSAPCFVATKLVAFGDRGKGDFYGSHDLEDVVTVVDGRARWCLNSPRRMNPCERSFPQKFADCWGCRGLPMPCRGIWRATRPASSACLWCWTGCGPLPGFRSQIHDLHRPIRTGDAGAGDRAVPR